MMFDLVELLKTRSEIYSFMCEYGKNLRSDKDFRKLIKVTHRDDSQFILFSCTWHESENMIFIWTEHCGYLYFYKEDIQEMDVQEWKWKGDPEEGDERPEEEDWEIIEHKIIIFNMEVKPSGTNQEEESQDSES